MNVQLLSNSIVMAKENFKSCANAIGVSQNTFTKVMRGERNLSTGEVDILIDFLGITNNEDKVRIFLH